MDALARKVLSVSELLAPQKLSLDKTAYADLIKNINLTYQKEVKVQESKLADFQEEALDIDRDWLDKVVYGIYDGMEEVNDYLKRSAEQIVLGNYTDEVTLLGTAGQIVLGVFDLDLLCDIRDLSADAGKILNGEDVSGLTVVLDVVALIPVIGAVKYLKNVDVLVKGAEAASDMGKIGKEADEIADVGEIIGENADKIGDIGKGISKDADVAVEEGAKSADEVVEGGLNIERVEYYLSQSRNNIDSDTAILGSTGKYDVIADNKGYTYFKMDDDVWASLEKEAANNYDEIWKVNQQFIDEQIASNKKILLSDDPNKDYYFSDGAKRFYQRELDYLSSKGYIFKEISDGIWEAIKK